MIPTIAAEQRSIKYSCRVMSETCYRTACWVPNTVVGLACLPMSACRKLVEIDAAIRREARLLEAPPPKVGCSQRLPLPGINGVLHPAGDGRLTLTPIAGWRGRADGGWFKVHPLPRRGIPTSGIMVLCAMCRPVSCRSAPPLFPRQPDATSPLAPQGSNISYQMRQLRPLWPAG